ncbi:QRFP-like peptide receptor [Nematostella vectensis]|uniref:QRFP-like peptide receptor n=1 Tax=Nematostella vectensis TaxID=45351 RepID=UPI0020773F37|nr:QRFP-like peptide receptor [Nematostella vectensis]
MNSTNASVITLANGCPPSLPTTLSRTLKSLAYIVIMLTSIFGNLLIVTIIYKIKRMRIPFNFFILNMAVADLLITVIFMPRMLTRILYGFAWQIPGMIGLVLCKLLPFLHEVFICVVVASMICIALERVFSLRFPTRRIITQRLSYFMILGSWLLALALRSPMLYALRLQEENGVAICFLLFETEALQRAYPAIVLAVFYVSPLTIIIVLYSVFLASFKRQVSPGRGARNCFAPGSTTRARACSIKALRATDFRRELERHRSRSILRVLLSVVVGFACCWVVYFVNPVLYHSYPVQACKLSFLQYLLAHVNSALTPCLYFAFNENFQSGLKLVILQSVRGRGSIRKTMVVTEADGSQRNNKLSVVDDSEFASDHKHPKRHRQYIDSDVYTNGFCPQPS